MANYKVVEFNGEMFQLIRRIKVSQVNGNMEGLKAWRDMLHCDHVLRAGEEFLMVRFVEDIEYETL